MQAVPPPPDSEGLIFPGDCRGPPVREEQAGPARLVPCRHERHVLWDPDGAVPTSREPPRRGCGSRRSVCSTVGRLAARDRDERVGPPRFVAMAALWRSPRLCGGLGIIGFGFARLAPLSGARACRCRRGRHGQRAVPHDYVEPIDPRLSTGTARRNRDAQLLLRSDARQRRIRLVESLAGLRASIVSGGVLCVLGTVALAAALPRFWNYDAAEGARLRDVRRQLTPNEAGRPSYLRPGRARHGLASELARLL